MLLTDTWKCCNEFISLIFWRSVLLIFAVLLLVIVIACSITVFSCLKLLQFCVSPNSLPYGNMKVNCSKFFRNTCLPNRYDFYGT